MVYDTDSKKLRLLTTAKLILSAKKNTIVLASNYPMSYARTIERNSRTIRDPDPLQSTMSSIARKFPITANPNSEFFSKIKSCHLMKKRDVRRHGRIPCSIKAVYEWIDSDIVVSDETTKLIDALYTHNMKKLTIINSLPWNKMFFKPTISQIVRKRIPTNVTEMHIPKTIRSDALAEAIGLDTAVEYNPVPQMYVNEIKRKLKLDHMSARSVPNVVQWMSSQLDEKMRYTPVVSTLNTDYAQVFHVLVQPCYRILGSLEILDKRKHSAVTLTSACILVNQAILFDEMQASKEEIVGSVTIEGIPLLQCLDGAHDNIHVKTTKAILGKPVTAACEYGDYTFSPYTAKHEIVEMTNAADYTFTIYSGEERVAFKSETSYGMFTRDDDRIIGINMNKPEAKEVRNTLANIASYCRWEFRLSRKSTILQMRTECIRKVTREPWKCVGATLSEWKNLERELERSDNHESITAGHLTLNEGVEYVEEGAQPVQWSKSSRAFLSVENQVVLSPREVINFNAEYGVQTNDVRLYKYLHGNELLLNLCVHSAYNLGKIVKRIEQNIWPETGDLLRKFIPIPLQNSVGATARHMLGHMVKSKAMDLASIVAFYHFGGIKGNGSTNIEKFKFVGNNLIHFNLMDGVLNCLNGHGKLNLFGKVITVSKNYHRPRLVSDDILPYCELKMFDEDKTRELVSMSKLSDYMRDKPDGTVVNTQFLGVKLTCTKNLYHDISTLRTIARVIDVTSHIDRRSQLTKLMEVSQAKKREFEGSHDVQEEVSAKRSKYSASISSSST